MEAAKAILVTGASTGIGRRVAERLAAAGHWVYATARKDGDLDELNAIDRTIMAASSSIAMSPRSSRPNRIIQNPMGLRNVQRHSAGRK